MATTVGSKMAGIERDCLALVSVLNNKGQYRGATQVQGLLQQVGGIRTTLEQGEDPPAEIEFSA
ncbi:MAG: hypothetical protein V3S69_06895 [Dehalococcoidales bacterium]